MTPPRYIWRIAGSARRWLRPRFSRLPGLPCPDLHDLRLTRLAGQFESVRKVMPPDYMRVLTVMTDAAASGLSEEETQHRVMAAAHG